MLFESYSIFIYILLFVIIYNGIKLLIRNAILRSTVILGANILILLTIISEHTLIVLSLLSILIFFIGMLLQKWNSRIVLGLFLTILISLFAIRNYPLIQEAISGGVLYFINGPVLSVQKIGLSYILFRYVHWLIESYRNTIHKSDFVTFINYILFFPSILAGPIDQYNNFHYWIGSRRAKYHSALFFAGASRIIIGAFKTLLIVPLIINYAIDYSVLLSDFTPLGAISLSLLAYSAYIYMDFSGYSDIAIGTAYMVGIKTPENFNNPYISQNLSEFWKRWHITFSFFLKIYVFKLFIIFYNKIINPKYRLLVTILCYLSTFLICGLWHGETINFVYWGLWHGVGLAINKIWVLKVRPKLLFRDKVYYKAISIIITFVYVTIGWAFFNYSVDQLMEIYNLFI